VRTATDNCGNATTASQVINVEDTTNPTLAGIPADVEADCNTIPAVPADGVVTADDNCDTDVEITFGRLWTNYHPYMDSNR